MWFHHCSFNCLSSIGGPLGCVQSSLLQNRLQWTILYIHPVIYIYANLCVGKSPEVKCEIAGSVSQCICNIEGHIPIVFQTAGLFGPHKCYRKVSVWEGKCWRTDGSLCRGQP